MKIIEIKNKESLKEMKNQLLNNKFINPSKEKNVWMVKEMSRSTLEANLTNPFINEMKVTSMAKNKSLAQNELNNLGKEPMQEQVLATSPALVDHDTLLNTSNYRSKRISAREMKRTALNFSNSKRSVTNKEKLLKEYRKIAKTGVVEKTVNVGNAPVVKKIRITSAEQARYKAKAAAINYELLQTRNNYKENAFDLKKHANYLEGNTRRKTKNYREKVEAKKLGEVVKLLDKAKTSNDRGVMENLQDVINSAKVSSNYQPQNFKSKLMRLVTFLNRGRYPIRNLSNHNIKKVQQILVKS